MTAPGESALARIDELCDRFEAAWQAGETPDPAALLGEVTPEERPALLKELLRLEAHYRQLRGEEPRTEAWARRRPEQEEWLRGQLADRELPAVPGYELPGRLGQGGMGAVYRARHRGLDRVVALKVIRQGAEADAGERARFRTEGEAAARLQHPGIVQVFEVGEHRGVAYMALELCDGGNLAEWSRRSPLAPHQAARVVEQLARAMQHAHSRGVIHRDLKPANVLRTAEGAWKITDFGLARRLDVDGGQTQTGEVLGTPGYLAPEQAAGRTGEVKEAADVWALGAVL